MVSETRLQRAVDVLNKAVDAGAMPGGVVAVAVNHTPILHQAFGTIDGERPATTATLYDLASLTKPMATGAVLLSLVEEGRVPLTITLGEVLGESVGTLAPVNLHQLLTHTSGLPPWIACYEQGMGLDTAVAAILQQPAAPPGTQYAYSCLGFILLHKILETVTGQSLETLAQERVFRPLGLTSFGYRPAETLRERIAPTIPREGPDAGETLRGIVHDGNARAIGGVSGNAGLFGTAEDVLCFGVAIQRPLTSAGLFGAATRERILTNQIKPEVGAHTLLFFAQGNGYCPTGDLLSPRAVGHSGYTGTLLTLDPAYGLTVVLLTNSVFGDGKPGFLAYRRRFLNALAAALV